MTFMQSQLEIGGISRESQTRNQISDKDNWVTWHECWYFGSRTGELKGELLFYIKWLSGTSRRDAARFTSHWFLVFIVLFVMCDLENFVCISWILIPLKYIYEAILVENIKTATLKHSWEQIWKLNTLLRLVILQLTQFWSEVEFLSFLNSDSTDKQPSTSPSAECYNKIESNSHGHFIYILTITSTLEVHMEGYHWAL